METALVLTTPATVALADSDLPRSLAGHHRLLATCAHLLGLAGDLTAARTCYQPAPSATAPGRSRP